MTDSARPKPRRRRGGYNLAPPIPAGLPERRRWEWLGEALASGGLSLIFPRRDPIPEDFTEVAFLPKPKYVVIEKADGWHAYSHDDHGAFS